MMKTNEGENCMSGTKERREMMEIVRTLPGKLEAAVKGLDDLRLDTPYGEGKWTVRQVVHHLADAHMNAFVRFKLIYTEDNPTLKPYDQDYWAETVDARQLPIDSSLEILRGIHRRWVQLMESLNDNDWQRPAVHPETGVVTLGSLLEGYGRHSENHLGQILSLKNKMGW